MAAHSDPQLPPSWPPASCEAQPWSAAVPAAPRLKCSRCSRQPGWPSARRAWQCQLREWVGVKIIGAGVGDVSGSLSGHRPAAALLPNRRYLGDGRLRGWAQNVWADNAAQLAHVPPSQPASAIIGWPALACPSSLADQYAPACSLTPFITSAASGSPLRMRCATSVAVPARKQSTVGCVPHS